MEPRTDNQPESIVVHADYHTETFNDLTLRHRKQIEEVLFVVPRVLRRQHFLPRLLAHGWMSGDAAWTVCSDYLSAIERQMTEILSRHSVFFWLHLYRRIGVCLAPGHGDHTDPVTIGLVRQIAELAIAKFGSVSKDDDLKVSTDAMFQQILGGHYRRVLQKQLREPGEPIRRFLALKAAPQWVATEFEPNDLVAVYANEGFAYEYWRVTALMRALGKGAEIARSEDDWIEYRENYDFSKLIESYDARIGGHSGSTLAGTWFGTRRREPDMLGSWMLLPYYNVKGLGAEDGISLPDVRLPSKRFFRPNFVLHSMDTIIFRDANSVMSEPFYRRRGYKLESLLTTLWGLGSSVLIPARILFRDRDDLPDLFGPAGLLTNNMLHMMQRGYGTFPTSDGLVREIIYRATLFDAPFAPYDESEIGACARDLILTEEKQHNISLWSNGPRYPIIPFGPSCTVLDLVSITPVLRTLFVRIRHDGSRRGTAFEEEFRSTLISAGFPVERFGALEAHDGQRRELDASVRLGSRLYLFECVSIEMPLDFEIGRIATIEHRTAELKAKLRQVLTLKDFVLDKPHGRNYDFRWAEDLRVFVVSPFIEWIWSRSTCLWDGPRPRVISAEEALEYLHTDAAASGRPGSS